MSRNLTHKLIVAIALAGGGAVALGATACKSHPAEAQTPPQQPVLGTWLDAGVNQGSASGAGSASGLGSDTGSGSAIPNSTVPGSEGSGISGSGQGTASGSAINPNPGSANPNPGSVNPNPGTVPPFGSGSSMPNNTPPTLPPAGSSSGSSGSGY